MKIFISALFVLLFCIQYNSNSQNIKVDILSSNKNSIDTILIQSESIRYRNLQFKFFNIGKKKIISLRVTITKDSNRLNFIHYSPNSSVVKSLVNLNYFSFDKLNTEIEDNTYMNISILMKKNSNNTYFLKNNLFFKTK